MIKAIIFDLDNTLLDFMKMKTAAVEAAADAMIDAGHTSSRGKLVEEIFSMYDAEGIEDQQVFDKVMLKKFGYVDYKILAAGILGYRRAKNVRLFLYPNVHATFIELARRGIRMGVISDAPRLPAWLRIVGTDLQHFFDFLISAEETGVKKPSPKPFLLALEKFGTTSDETLMVGDWIERDIVGAKSLGIQTCFALYGNVSSEAKESGADYEITDIKELLAIVDMGRKPKVQPPSIEDR